MPELKIPKSMINVDPENASSSAEMPDASGIFGSIEDIAASVGDRSEKDKDKDFNLEVEAKYAKKLCDIDTSCDMALLQINKRMYAEEFADDYDEILCYGISFFRKRCRVRKR